jgi:CheY-specific phosphatase CheX
MASDPLEKKLDRYYEDLMSKILEVIDMQRVIIGEQKDLKRDIAKMKEYVLENKETLERIDARTEAMKMGGGHSTGYKSSSDSSVSAPIPRSAPPLPTSGPTPVEVISAPKPMPSGAPSNQNLKDYLSAQLAIFDVKVLNAFIKSTKEIVKSNSRVEPTFIKPVIESKINFPIIVAGKMNLARDKGNGSMALCFDQASANAITRAVFMLPEEGRVTDSDIKDVTCEICNQICGKSKLALKNEGYSFEIDMPEIHQGSPMELYALLGYPKIVLQFEYNKNPFFIYFWG